jgi:hypothetical protein
VVPTLSADAFAALARSSPWRWSTLRFTVAWPADRWKPGAVRAWVRRPDVVRVENSDGELLQVVREEAARGRPLPVLRPDGLVESRAGWRGSDGDDPMYQDYHWVAMLDPVELADGEDREGPPVLFDDLRDIEHAGRPAWEAVVRTTDGYEPRCGCCPLLRTRRVDLLEYADHPQHVLSAYPDAYRVRLDVGTGVCVLTEEIGGLTPGRGHRLSVEAVDEPMDDDLFAAPPRRPFQRRGWSWAQYPGPT